MSKNIHTVPHGDGWANRVAGANRVSNTSPTNAEAQARGQEMAIERNSEHLVHRKDGAIQQRNTYPKSRDPQTRRG